MSVHAHTLADMRGLQRWVAFTSVLLLAEARWRVVAAGIERALPVLVLVYNRCSCVHKVCIFMHKPQPPITLKYVAFEWIISAVGVYVALLPSCSMPMHARFLA